MVRVVGKEGALGQLNMCLETIPGTLFRGDKCDGFGNNTSVYHVYPGVSRTISEYREGGVFEGVGLGWVYVNPATATAMVN